MRNEEQAARLGTATLCIFLLLSFVSSHLPLLPKVEVLHAQRAAADGVSLLLALLSAHAQGQHVDDPHGRGQLPVEHVLGPQVLFVVRADLVDAALWVCVGRRRCGGWGE